MPQFSELLIFYIVAVSVTAVVVTVADKIFSKNKKKRRISEFTLMLIGFFGGALPMYVTMKVVRHKTRHKKFMIGLPLEIVFHIIIILLYIVWAD